MARRQCRLGSSKKFSTALGNLLAPWEQPARSDRLLRSDVNIGGSLGLPLVNVVSTETLLPASGAHLRAWPVSRRVNNSKADKDDRTLIEPIEPATA